MSAVIRYLPTAGIAPLPRKSNVGRLPNGIIRFSAAKREMHARRAAAALPAFKLDAHAAAQTFVDARRAGKPITMFEIIEEQRRAFYSQLAPPKGAARDGCERGIGSFEEEQNKLAALVQQRGIAKGRQTTFEAALKAVRQASDELKFDGTDGSAA